MLKMSPYVVAALLLLAGVATALEYKQDVPLFVKTLRELQRGPPKQTMKSRALVRTEHIAQKLDHFNATNNKEYQMRYMVNDEFLTEGSPIFIFLGGEWEIEPSMLTGGLWYDLAAQHKGVLIYTEHRYYGKSVPTLTMSTNNLKYLHVKQALADVAFFIESYKAANPQLAKSKVVLSGGSYSATMVVWFKRLYPELIVGGWASSAPLLAKLDFKEYKEVVGQAFKQLGGQQCYNRIENGIAELEDMFDNDRMAEAHSALKLCSSFDEQNDLDVWNLFGSISNIFSGIAQYQEKGDIEYYCDYLMGFEDDVSAVAGLVQLAWGNTSCIDVRFSQTVAYYKMSAFIFDSGRPWYYQTCNEYGWYQSSSSRNQPFGRKFPTTMYIELCKEIFGKTYGNEGISNHATQTNLDFGGLEPAVENIYMTHGALDPWSAIGHGVNEGATVIANASHCADFSSISDSDSAEMRASKVRLTELVAEWLK